MNEAEAADALLALARHFLRYGASDKALTLLDAAKELGADSADIDALRSEALMRSGNPADAARHAERALSGPPRAWARRLRLLHVSMLNAAGRIADARARLKSLGSSPESRKTQE